jgi:hypothetical protein
MDIMPLRPDMGCLCVQGGSRSYKHSQVEAFWIDCRELDYKYSASLTVATSARTVLFFVATVRVSGRLLVRHPPGMNSTAGVKTIGLFPMLCSLSKKFPRRIPAVPCCR